jgi:hypothetical protein
MLLLMFIAAHLLTKGITKRCKSVSVEWFHDLTWNYLCLPDEVLNKRVLIGTCWVWLRQLREMNSGESGGGVFKYMGCIPD